MTGLTNTDGFGFLITFPKPSLIFPSYNFQIYSAYLSRMSLRAIASVAKRVRQLGCPQNTSSTVISSKGFSQASLPTMQPCRLCASTSSFAAATFFSPPFNSKVNSGNSFFSRQTRSQMRGGTVRFCAGLSPFNIAFLACITKCLIAPYPPLDTSFTNATKNQKVSNSSTPKRHLTVHRIDTAFAIASIQSRTRIGSFMRQAPKDPFWTRGLGHPTLRLIQSQPYCSPSLAACARRSGSHPPS